MITVLNTQNISMEVHGMPQVPNEIIDLAINALSLGEQDSYDLGLVATENGSISSENVTKSIDPNTLEI